MKQYFEKMDPIGKTLSPKQMETMKDNITQAEEIMKQIRCRTGKNQESRRCSGNNA